MVRISTSVRNPKRQAPALSLSTHKGHLSRECVSRALYEVNNVNLECAVTCAQSRIS